MEPSDLLIRNCAIFKQIKKLAIEQEKLLQAFQEDQIYDFLDLATKREHLQHEVSANEKRYSRLTGNRSVMKGAGKAHDISKEISETIKSIQRIDDNLEKVLIEKKDFLLFDIKNVRKGRKALKGYAGYAQKRPKFIDKQG